jgi:hypothetical protein
MNRILLTLPVAMSLAIAGCSSLPSNSREQAGTPIIAKPEASNTAATPKRSPNLVIANDSDGTVVIQKVEPRPGVSSATVERLGKLAGCNASAGAGLITQKGPVEVYRMQCDSGQMHGATFTAKCELRQCKPML